MLKNITLNADAMLIQRSRERARRENTTLNQVFQAWLARYANPQEIGSQYDELMSRLTYAEAGQRFSREEINDR